MEDIQNTAVPEVAETPQVINTPKDVVPKAKQSLFLWLVLGATLVVAVGMIIFKDQLFTKGTGTNLTPTPVPMATLTLVNSATPLVAEIGKEFSFQIRVKETLSTPTFFVEQLQGAVVSSAGLITWTPTAEGTFTGKAKVNDTNAKGELELKITVTKPIAAVQDKYVIPETFVLPSYPIFYSLETKNVRQLWVMNKDGSDQKFTGVENLWGSIENVKNYGGILYTVDSSANKGYPASLKIYYYSTITGTTTIIEHEAAPKGYNATVSGPMLSPSMEYLVYVYGVNKQGEMGDDITYYAYNLALKERKKMVEGTPSVSLVWSKIPNSVYLAQGDGLYAYHVWDGTKVLIKKEVGSIPNEMEYLEVSEGVSLNIVGKSDEVVRLVLTKNGVAQDVDSGSWGELQAFYCVTPDAKKVLYEKDVYKGSYSYGTVKSLDIDSGAVAAVTTQNPGTESYSLIGCFWTSSHTVIIQKIIDGFEQTAPIYLMELDVDTNNLRQLTTVGRASLVNY